MYLIEFFWHPWKNIKSWFRCRSQSSRILHVTFYMTSSKNISTPKTEINNQFRKKPHNPTLYIRNHKRTRPISSAPISNESNGPGTQLNESSILSPSRISILQVPATFHQHAMTYTGQPTAIYQIPAGPGADTGHKGTNSGDPKNRSLICGSTIEKIVLVIL